MDAVMIIVIAAAISRNAPKHVRSAFVWALMVTLFWFVLIMVLLPPKVTDGNASSQDNRRKMFHHTKTYRWKDFPFIALLKYQKWKIN